MGRREEAADLLRAGHSPTEIAHQMNVTVTTVMGYLLQKVGSGEVRRSDIAFSIDRKTRRLVEQHIKMLGTAKWYEIFSAISHSDHSIGRDDVEIYLQFRNARVVLGDMYELIRGIEISLHTHVYEVLREVYGQEHWWTKGIPLRIRKACAERREEDPARLDHYCYCDFIHLKEILDKQWGVLSKSLPKNQSSNKGQFLSRLTRLNEIRNCVMHPVRGAVPTEHDFEFVRDFHRAFDELQNETR